MLWWKFHKWFNFSLLSSPTLSSTAYLSSEQHLQGNTWFRRREIPPEDYRQRSLTGLLEEREFSYGCQIWPETQPVLALARGHSQGQKVAKIQTVSSFGQKWLNRSYWSVQDSHHPLVELLCSAGRVGYSLRSNLEEKNALWNGNDDTELQRKHTGILAFFSYCLFINGGVLPQEIKSLPSSRNPLALPLKKLLGKWQCTTIRCRCLLVVFISIHPFPLGTQLQGSPSDLCYSPTFSISFSLPIFWKICLTCSLSSSMQFLSSARTSGPQQFVLPSRQVNGASSR